MLTFRDTDKKFELDGDLSKVINNKNYKVDFAELSDKKRLFDFGKEMYFDEKTLGKKSTRDKSFMRLLQQPAIMTTSLKKKASSKPKTTNLQKSKTRLLSSNPTELYDRLKILLQ